MRVMLGKLYRAGRLTTAQVATLLIPDTTMTEQ